MKISIIIPCYRSEMTIGTVVEELVKHVGVIADYEIILVNDNSPDNTWKTISRIAYSDIHVKALNLSRNCGQHSAILAGARVATGDYVAVVDDDGQTPVEYIPQMIDIINNGWDVVCAKYLDRGRDSLFRDFGSFLATKMSKWLLNEPKDLMVTVFFVAKRYVIDEIVKYNQPYPYLAGLLLRTTSKITNITLDQRTRIQGKSGYSLKKLIGLWLNGFTAFSIKPLQFTSYIGVMSSLVGFIIAIISVVRKIIGYEVLIGWTSLMVVLLILGGSILIVLGLLGEYVGRIYLSINMTPQSIISESIGVDKIQYNDSKGNKEHE